MPDHDPHDWHEEHSLHGGLSKSGKPRQSQFDDRFSTTRVKVTIIALVLIGLAVAPTYNGGSPINYNFSAVCKIYNVFGLCPDKQNLIWSEQNINNDTSAWNIAPTSNRIVTSANVNASHDEFDHSNDLAQQRKSFFAQGRYWIFYESTVGGGSSTNHMNYTTSTTITGAWTSFGIPNPENILFAEGTSIAIDHNSTDVFLATIGLNTCCTNNPPSTASNDPVFYGNYLYDGKMNMNGSIVWTTANNYVSGGTGAFMHNQALRVNPLYLTGAFTGQNSSAIGICFSPASTFTVTRSAMVINGTGSAFMQQAIFPANSTMTAGCSGSGSVPLAVSQSVQASTSLPQGNCALTANSGGLTDCLTTFNYNGPNQISLTGGNTYFIATIIQNRTGTVNYLVAGTTASNIVPHKSYWDGTKWVRTGQNVNNGAYNLWFSLYQTVNEQLFNPATYICPSCAALNLGGIFGNVNSNAYDVNIQYENSTKQLYITFTIRQGGKNGSCRCATDYYYVVSNNPTFTSWTLPQSLHQIAFNGGGDYQASIVDTKNNQIYIAYYMFYAVVNATGQQTEIFGRTLSGLTMGNEETIPRPANSDPYGAFAYLFNYATNSISGFFTYLPTTFNGTFIPMRNDNFFATRPSGSGWGVVTIRTDYMNAFDSSSTVNPLPSCVSYNPTFNLYTTELRVKSTTSYQLELEDSNFNFLGAATIITVPQTDTSTTGICPQYDNQNFLYGGDYGVSFSQVHTIWVAQGNTTPLQFIGINGQCANTPNPTTPKICLSEERNQVSLAIDKNPISGLSIASAKELFMQIAYHQIDTTLTNQFPQNDTIWIFLTRSNGLPNNLNYNPKNDLAVDLLIQINYNFTVAAITTPPKESMWLYMRPGNTSQTIGQTSPRFCSYGRNTQSGSLYSCSTTNTSPVNLGNDVTLNMQLNYTGFNPNTSYLFDQIITGTNALNSTTLPWFDLSGTYYLGLAATSTVSGNWCGVSCLGFYFDNRGSTCYSPPPLDFRVCMILSWNIPTPIASLPSTTPPNLEPAGFLTRAFNALIATANFFNPTNSTTFLNPHPNQGNIFFQAILASFSFLSNSVVSVLNSVGNTLHIGNLGTNISSFFTAIGAFLSGVLGGIFTFFTNGIGYLTNAVSVIGSFFNGNLILGLWNGLLSGLPALISGLNTFLGFVLFWYNLGLFGFNIIIIFAILLLALSALVDYEQSGNPIAIFTGIILVFFMFYVMTLPNSVLNIIATNATILSNYQTAFNNTVFFIELAPILFILMLANYAADDENISSFTRGGSQGFMHNFTSTLHFYQMLTVDVFKAGLFIFNFSMKVLVSVKQMVAGWI